MDCLKPTKSCSSQRTALICDKMFPLQVLTLESNIFKTGRTKLISSIYIRCHKYIITVNKPT